MKPKLTKNISSLLFVRWTSSCPVTVPIIPINKPERKISETLSIKLKEFLIVIRLK